MLATARVRIIQGGNMFATARQQPQLLSKKYVFQLQMLLQWMLIKFGKYIVQSTSNQNMILLHMKFTKTWIYA